MSLVNAPDAPTRLQSNSRNAPAPRDRDVDRVERVVALVKEVRDARPGPVLRADDKPLGHRQ